MTSVYATETRIWRNKANSWLRKNSSVGSLMFTDEDAQSKTKLG